MHYILLLRKKLKYFKKHGAYLKVTLWFMMISFIVMLYMHYFEDLSWVDAYYFTLTTATTVGFGDYSPHRDFGKIFITFYQIFGIGMLGLIIGFIAENMLKMSELSRKGMLRMKKDVEVLIVGYPNELKVKSIIEQLQADPRFENKKIVCLNNILSEAPLWMTEKDVSFVKGIGSDVEVLNRAKITSVKTALILANESGNITSDDYSTSAVTVIESISPDTYTIVERVRDDLTLFASTNCDVVIKENKAEILAQEILDHGASQFEEAVFSNTTAGTQFNIVHSGEETTWKELGMSLFLKGHIPEGYALPNEKVFNFSPKLEDVIPSGSTIKYRGNQPITD